MDDLIGRLRTLISDDETEYLAWDAANRIEQQSLFIEILKAERNLFQKISTEQFDRILKLEAALKPLADKYLYPDDTSMADEIRADEDWSDQYNEDEYEDMWIKRGWIRAARVALGVNKNDNRD
jgi:hypothetical protein